MYGKTSMMEILSILIFSPCTISYSIQLLIIKFSMMWVAILRNVNKSWSIDIEYDRVTWVKSPSFSRQQVQLSFEKRLVWPFTVSLVGWHFALSAGDWEDCWWSQWIFLIYNPPAQPPTLSYSSVTQGQPFHCRQSNITFTFSKWNTCRKVKVEFFKRKKKKGNFLDLYFYLI